MKARQLCYMLIILVFAFTQGFAWFNRGFDKTLRDMQKLFAQRNFIELYDVYVHPDIKHDINGLVIKMRSEKRYDKDIAVRLRFSSINEYHAATPHEILLHFFKAMTSLRFKKPSNIKNDAYLRLALSLSLLFAFLDNGMNIVDKDIGLRCGIVTYRGNNFTMKTYFYYQNGKWWLTDGRHCL